jgi:hypothetical protein
MIFSLQEKIGAVKERIVKLSSNGAHIVVGDRDNEFLEHESHNVFRSPFVFCLLKIRGRRCYLELHKKKTFHIIALIRMDNYLTKTESDLRELKPHKAI